MKADLAHVISDIQTALLQVRASSEAAKRQLSAGVEQLRSEIAALKVWTAFLDSLVVSSFPPLFDEFRGKRFALLWRGNRDGFAATDFHGRCDGGASTLTLILDTDGNVFGSSTPLGWELCVESERADATMRCQKFGSRAI
jgi:hypothetical protein